MNASVVVFQLALVTSGGHLHNGGGWMCFVPALPRPPCSHFDLHPILFLPAKEPGVSGEGQHGIPVILSHDCLFGHQLLSFMIFFAAIGQYSEQTHSYSSQVHHTPSYSILLHPIIADFSSLQPLPVDSIIFHPILANSNTLQFQPSLFHPISAT